MNATHRKLVCYAVGAGLVSAVYADVPRLLHYQGKLRNAGGAAVTGVVSIRFRLYDSPTSAAPVLFDESHAAVSVSNGLFSVLIGSQAGGVSDAIVENPSVYLGGSINDGIELLPRVRIGSTPSALKSRSAEQLVLPGTVTPAVTVAEAGTGTAIILRDTDGSGCHRISVDSSGTISTMPVACGSGMATPTVTNISPAARSIDYASFTATITGTDFLASAQARIGTLDLLAESAQDSTTLTATVPEGLPLGTYDVSVSNDGVDYGTGIDLFRITDAISEDFESYADDASIHDGSGGTGWSTHWQVLQGNVSSQSSVTYAGIRAMKLYGQDPIAQRSFPAKTAGVLRAAFRTAGQPSQGVLYLMSGAETRGLVALFTYSFGDIRYLDYQTNDTAAQPVLDADYNIDQWYLVDIEFDTLADRYRVRLDQGHWSCWAGLRLASGSIDTIRFERGDLEEGIFVDDIYLDAPPTQTVTTIAKEDFEGSGTGNLNGQNLGCGWSGAWSGSGVYQVVADQSMQGSRLVRAANLPNDAVISRTISPSASGIFSIRVKKTADPTGDFQIRLQRTGEASGFGGITYIAFSRTGNIDIAGAPGAGTWTPGVVAKVDVDYDSIGQRFKYRINDGIWSDWLNEYEPESDGNVYKIHFTSNGNSSGTSEFDDIVIQTVP